MENIITLVGFLGAGKTTLLKHLIASCRQQAWQPYVILNDYENADMDAQQLVEQLNPDWINTLSGSCICCSGIHQLRDLVNRIPARENGITLIEANGTSDACSLMGFLGVGIEERFAPPVQVSVVDVKNWQKRGEHNALESNQIQVSSLIVLNHTKACSAERITDVMAHLTQLNPSARLIAMDEVEAALLPQLIPSTNTPAELAHLKAHWSSCSVDLPDMPSDKAIVQLCRALPKSILRIKGCTRVVNEDTFTYFETTPDGKVIIRPFNGTPTISNKLLTVGVGSDPIKVKATVDQVLLQNINV